MYIISMKECRGTTQQAIDDWLNVQDVWCQEIRNAMLIADVLIFFLVIAQD
jgi:hypothetical protein